LQRKRQQIAGLTQTQATLMQQLRLTPLLTHNVFGMTLTL
jgi:hypothetical protein